MTDAEFKERTEQVVSWVKHPAPFPGQTFPVDKQKLSLERDLLREMLVRAGLL